MFRTLFSLLLLLVVSARTAIVLDITEKEHLRHTTGNGRIVGGYEVTIPRHPYQVSLQYKSCTSCTFKHVCGGTIVNGKSILTAAHCVYNRNTRSFLIVAGTTDRRGIGGLFTIIERIVIHDSYSPATKDNDIALLFLGAEIPLDNFTRAAVTIADVAPRAGTISKAIGWGTISESGILSSQLMEVEVPIVSIDNCRESYGQDKITDSMICAGVAEGGRDACQYDSGGPLLANRQQVGIISWGLGCARPGYPGVYVNVPRFKEWIESTLSKYAGQTV